MIMRGLDEGGRQPWCTVFQRGPAYANAVRSAMNGTWKNHFEWNVGLEEHNNPDTSAVGFIRDRSPGASAAVDKFIDELARDSIMGWTA